MADFPQQYEVHVPERTVSPPHPGPAPPYYPVPVPGQPHGFAGVVPDDEVSIDVVVISH